MAADEIPPASYQVGFAVQGERKAVVRNRLKRWARESFRLNKQALVRCCATLPAGTACVFLISQKRMREPASFHHFNDTMTQLIDDLCVQLTDTYGKA